MDPNLPIDTPEVIPPVATTIKRSSLIVCQFCECELTPVGDCFRMSDRAKGINRQDEQLDDLKVALAKVQAQLTTTTAALESAQQEVRRLTTQPKKHFLEK